MENYRKTVLHSSQYSVSYQVTHAYQDIFCIFPLRRYIHMSYEMT